VVQYLDNRLTIYIIIAQFEPKVKLFHSFLYSIALKLTVILSYDKLIF
jgi:hypothetical protein